MIALHRRLPSEEQYPLPPREITEKITSEIAPTNHLSQPARSALSWLAHFGYGGAAGLIYSHAAISLRPTLRGPLFGLFVWLTSYFGLLPALGILKSAEKHPARRNLLMILAHLVWGLFLGLLLETFLRDQRKSAAAFGESNGTRIKN